MSRTPNERSGPAPSDLVARVRAAKSAQTKLRVAPAATRTRALERVGDFLTRERSRILYANGLDLRRAELEGLAAPLLSRLRLTESKLQVLQEGLAQLARSEDPIGRVLIRRELDRGLELEQVQSPIGVVLVAFESRPDAVIQIGGLALRSGNAVLLKGGAEALKSNRILVEGLRLALAESGLDSEAIQGIEGREAFMPLLAMDGLIDLVIPRGSNAFVQLVQRSTKIPVLGHAEGICTLYVDRAADPATAIRLALDGKCDSPSACNATETLLIHRDALPALASIGAALHARGVRMRADEAARAHLPYAEAAGEADGATEYGDLILAIRVVDSFDQALAWIATHGSAHTDAIVSEDPEACARFLAEVDSASVFANASTRFADGYRFGLGAEVGISTGRIHARGPVGIAGLLTTRYLLRGHGHIASDYGPGKRAFLHRELEP